MVRNPNSSPSSRVTIMLDMDLEKKLRGIQAKQINLTNSSVSFSATLNLALRKQLKM